MTWLAARLERTGPMESAALLRIGLALLLWTRFGVQVATYFRPDLQFALLAAVFFPATTALLVGWQTRAATVITTACLWTMWWYFAPYRDMVGPYDHHHTRLLFAVMALMCLVPSGRVLSVDRWLALRRAERTRTPPPTTEGPLYGLDLIALQVSTVYFWTAWDKTQWAFLSGERLEHMLLRWYTPVVPDEPWLHGLTAAAAWAVVAIEYVLPFALFVPRWQKVAMPVGLVMHAAFFVLLPVSTFTATMALLYLAYLPAEGVARTLRRGLSPDDDDPAPSGVDEGVHHPERASVPPL